MEFQYVINVFTIVGSIIGIIGFLLSIFRPFSSHNLKKWNELTSDISFGDLDEYCESVSYGVVRSNSHSRLRDFVSKIRLNAESVKFKGPGRKKIEKKLNRIESLYQELCTEYGKPYWVLHHLEHLDYKLDKDYFYREESSQSEADANVKKAMKKTQSLISKLSSTYNDVYKLTNRLPIEYLIK